MSKILLTAKPLLKSSFASFGDVIETDGAEQFPINAGTIMRYNNLANIIIDFGSGGEVNLSIMQTLSATQLPALVRMLERHPKGSQAFIPTFDAPIIVVVAPSGDRVDPHQLQAFVSNGHQGYNFRPGVWHMPLMTPVVAQQVIVVDRKGPGNNCDEWHFEEEIFVSL